MKQHIQSIRNHIRTLSDKNYQNLEGIRFGAPTYVVGDELFWGQDRLDFVERALAQG